MSWLKATKIGWILRYFEVGLCPPLSEMSLNRELCLPYRFHANKERIPVYCQDFGGKSLNQKIRFEVQLNSKYKEKVMGYEFMLKY